MSRKNNRRGSASEQRRRREEVAFLIDEMTNKELAEYAGVSLSTIEKDIQYIEAHRSEFYY